MSELQLALVILGFVLVVAVWGYNRWSETRHRRRAESLLNPAAAATDVLMGEPAMPMEKTEPGFAPPPEPVMAPEAPSADVPVAMSAVAPEAAPVPPEPASAAPGFMDPDLPLDPEPPAKAETGDVDLLLDIDTEKLGRDRPIPQEWGDGQADALIRVDFIEAVAAAALKDECRDWLPRLDKPLQWLGQDDRTGHWRALSGHDGSRVSRLVGALQMVDRTGALTEDALATFIQGMSRLARRFNGKALMPDVPPLLARARELDAFCASVDLQLTLHVLPVGSLPMSGQRLGPIIESCGLVLDGERHVAFNADGAEEFALLCRAARTASVDHLESMELIDLIFSLDVPRIARGTEAFDRMIQFARQCVATLDGQLADAHRKPLMDATITMIRGRIDELQKRMRERGIPPGSARALRLFS